MYEHNCKKCEFHSRDSEKLLVCPACSDPDITNLEIIPNAGEEELPSFSMKEREKSDDKFTPADDEDVGEDLQ